MPRIKDPRDLLSASYDLVVVGGGMAGLCAAISAARHGAKTALLQDRPVLGGNASSEIRMHICGATRHGQRPNARETGIIEEILLENKYRNPTHSYGMFDVLLWEKAAYQDGLDLYLNTSALQVHTEQGHITEIIARQTTTEKTFVFRAAQYMDCSGDGMISALAGASYMFGREAAAAFEEPGAVETADTVTMGNSIQFRALDEGREVVFHRPDWAYDYHDADWIGRVKFAEITSGYWWLEIGGTQWNVVNDSETTRDEMLRILFGLWDYIKNYSNVREQAANLALDWVAFVPGKRESRRIVGDYVLREQDLLEGRVFEDAVAYGGWHIDTHRPEGFYAFIHKEPQPVDANVVLDDLYTIPYRSLYARDVDNLFLGGRIISATHRAFASTRVMATCAVAAQAAGTAAAMAVEKGCGPRDILSSIQELQQTLLRDGCYIPGTANADPDDLARTAAVSCSSETAEGGCALAVNGWNRPIGEQNNMWISGSLEETPQWLQLSWQQPIKPRELRLTFDSDLSAEIMISLSKWHHVRQQEGVPDTLVRDYRIVMLKEGREIYSERVEENRQRLRIHPLPGQDCNQVRIEVLRTWGCEQARLCEIRVYAQTDEDDSV